MARYKETDPHAAGRPLTGRLWIAMVAGALGTALALATGAAG